MKCWDEMWAAHGERFSRLTEAQQLQLLAACVARAVWRLGPALHSPLIRHALPVLHRTVNLLWDVARDPRRRLTDKSLIQAQLAQIHGIIPEDDVPAHRLLGWLQCTFALGNALSWLCKTQTANQFLATIECCYQVPWFQQIYPLTAGGRSEQQLYELEQANSTCSEDLAFQLECLRRLEEGEALERSLPASG